MKSHSFASIVWDSNGVPRSTVFDDQYFCQDNGYEEALHVCCHGNDLSARFKKLDPARQGTFTIIETGFGTGLDFCCAWKTWEESAPKSWRLHFVSVELYPVSPDDLKRALALWPAITPYKEALAAQYRPVPGSISEMSFNNDRVKLTIVFDDVVSALRTILQNQIVLFGADAWFLDGFGPAKNPEMWSEDVFVVMASLSQPGTTMSTFTVAGVVRRGLEAHGFTLKKIPGHGRKNQILSGVFR
ncbi:MAG: tRNA (5-methylaminomethyl-2-thiouridine)(34)-methyltransferase MnmD [Candidatus Omnitrophica bacterium]|nr:tRNA (5-methylaminomethyl-2-thiouridine)(34)-methyltransferase MnmD [Candidatus Omnitrophota bacterium]